MLLRLCLSLALACAAAAQPAAAQRGDLTLDTVYGNEPPWGRTFDRIAWAPDGKHFLFVRLSQVTTAAEPLQIYDVASGTSRIWLAPQTADGTHVTPQVVAWSPDSRRVALSIAGDLYVASGAGNGLTRVAQDVDDARWSPHADAIAYAREADLYVATLAGGAIERRRITTGGIPGKLLNGTLDWVYPEELGIEHGFAWSPDGRTIAYLHMDERPVENFPIVDFLRPENTVEEERYPLAGGANPRVTLRAVSAHGTHDRVVYDAAPKDEYVAAFDWIPHSSAVVAEILDRRQQTMRVLRLESGAAARAELYRQTSSSWVDVQPLPHWTASGHPVWLLDREKTAGVYVGDARGALRRISPKDTRVFEIAGVDERGRVYVLAAYPRRDRVLLRLNSNGEFENLTPAAGWHAVVVAPSLDRFVDTFSTVNDPPSVSLVTVASGEKKTLLPRSDSLAAKLLPVELPEVPSAYGPLDATMLKPPGFDPSKKYPVVVYVYGGPDAPTTANRFGGLYHQLLARQGFIVFSIDGPASQVDSDERVRLLLHNFGPGSLLGQEIGARYLASLPYVDPARIGIWGWSFGGYETAYALTHSTLFAAGAAVAPVTDWHLYDSIYTERYMGLPKEHPDAYAKSSVLNAAGHLNGPLVIQHGTADDNVHMANTLSLLQQFVLAKEPRVWFYPYPRKTHGIRGLPQQRSVYAHMLEFWKATFAP